MISNAPNGQIRALNLCEAGVPMPFAQSRPASGTSRYFFTYDRAFHRIGTWTRSGSAITGVTDTTVIPAFTDTQLSRAFAVLHISGNTVWVVTISGSNAAPGP